MKVNNLLKNISGDFEALGLDISDILKMERNLNAIKTEINDLKILLDKAFNLKNDMLKKLGIELYEK